MTRSSSGCARTFCASWWKARSLSRNGVKEDDHGPNGGTRADPRRARGARRELRGPRQGDRHQGPDVPRGRAARPAPAVRRRGEEAGGHRRRARRDRDGDDGDPAAHRLPLTTDPFKYRLMELVGVYGDALRERCNELFGDGILSAIDCVVKLEKKGERGVLTIDAKFLHYKEY